MKTHTSFWLLTFSANIEPFFKNCKGLSNIENRNEIHIEIVTSRVVVLTLALWLGFGTVRTTFSNSV